MRENTLKTMQGVVIGALVISILFAFDTFSYAQTDVTDKIELVYSRMMYNRRTGQTSLDVALKNISQDSLLAPIKVVVDTISDANVTAANADGLTDDDKPYFMYDLEIDGGQLESGSTSGNKRWIFNDPTRARFSFTVLIYSVSGPDDTIPPEISITNPVNNCVTTSTNPYITIIFSDDDSGIDTSSCSIEMDGVDLTSQFTVTGAGATGQLSSALGAGSHVISATISDNASNTSTALCNVTVASSSQPIRYLFSLPSNDWIFASPGDGTCVEYASGEDLGLTEFSDLVSVSRVTPGGDLFFTLMDTGGIFQSPADGSKSLYFNNAQMGFSDAERIVANHIGLDGSSFFAADGQSDIFQSDGDGTNSLFEQNVSIGIADADQLECLHMGYDSTFYFCFEGAQGIYQSPGDGTNRQYLTPAELGVPGCAIDAFAILPETVPPQIAITNPSDGAFLNTDTPNITVTFQDEESGINPVSFYAEINGADMTSAFIVTSTGASYKVPGSAPLPVGDNTMFVRINDRVGNEGNATSNFRVGVLRAIPGATPTSGPSPLTVHFTTDGEDPAGTIEVFRWDFETDGTWDTYDTVARDYNRTYSTPGTYNATLFVQSSTGGTATASITITVENNPPVATADVVPSNGEVPLAVMLYGSGTDSDGSIVLYEWDFEGDGTYDWSSTTTGNTSYTYSTVGTYQAVFRVTDDNGLTGTAVATTTVVRAGPPGSPTATASANPDSGNAPLTVNFSGTATDPDNDIVLYEWDFDGDGVYDWSSATTGSTSHTYNTAGTHVASFRVTDATGLTGIDQILITVNIQPSLSIARDTVGFLSDSGMTANASSQYSSSSFSPSKAIDGYTSTYWIAAVGDNVPGSWFEVTFNSPQRVSGFTVNWYNSSYKMQRGRVEIYDVNGAILYSVETDLIGVPSQVSFPSVENASRLRLVTVTTTVTDYHIIREFEVDSTPMPDSQEEPTGTNINTSISAGTQVSILIKNSDGNTVRTLVNNEYRDMGSYADYWNCKDDNGFVANDGVYYAILQYIVDGQVQTYDLTNSTGGSRFNPPRQSTGGSTSNPADSKPFEDQFLPIHFSLNKASEVTLFVGVLWTTNTRIRTIYNRIPLPAGSHTSYWDGLDDNENIAQAPPGNYLILGIWGYTLPDNAIFMTGGKPEVSQPAAEPNYYSPFSEKCDSQGNGEGILLTYDVSENVSSVELRVYSLETGNLIRSALQLNVSAGNNTFFWDGKNNNGEYPDIGDYQVGLIATDVEGNESMLSYTLVRIDY